MRRAHTLRIPCLSRNLPRCRTYLSGTRRSPPKGRLRVSPQLDRVFASSPPNRAPLIVEVEAGREIALVTTILKLVSGKRACSTAHPPAQQMRRPAVSPVRQKVT